MEIVLNALAVLLAASLVIWIVGRLRVGLTVSNFGSAFLAAAVIAVIAALFLWLSDILGLGPWGPTVNAFLYMIFAAIILIIASRFVSGVQVYNFGGAIVAAVAIAIVTWILIWLLSFVGLP